MLESGKRVCVAVRVRPVLRSGASAVQQQERHELEALTKLSDTQIKVEQKRQDEACRSSVFTFDYIFDQDSTQLEVYEEVVLDMVDAALCGTNATILAYGQTGSGKTHTVLGDFKSNPLDSDLLTPESGIFLRVLSDLMTFKLQREVKGTHVVVGLSCVEIYNDSTRDLMGKSSSSSGALCELKVVMVGDDVHLPNLVMKEVTSLQAVFAEIQAAIGRRQSRATEMNSASSRSHCLFMIDILQQKATPGVPPPTLAALDHARKHSDPSDMSQGVSAAKQGGVGATTRDRGRSTATPPSSGNSPTIPPTPGSQFNDFPGTIIRLPGQQEPIFASKILLADLAGSEKIKSSGVSGEGLAEATGINSSLTALGNVVHALHEGSGFVSYRTSNLTRLLKPTFNQPTSRVLLLAQCSPTQLTFDETVNTFHFANKVKAMRVATTTGAESDRLQFDVIEVEKLRDAVMGDLRIWMEEHEATVILRRRFPTLRLSALAYEAKAAKTIKEKGISAPRKQLFESHQVFAASEAARSDRLARLDLEAREHNATVQRASNEEATKRYQSHLAAVGELQQGIRAANLEHVDEDAADLHAERAFEYNYIVEAELIKRMEVLRHALGERRVKHQSTGLKVSDSEVRIDEELKRRGVEVDRLRASVTDMATEKAYASSCYAHCAAKRFFSSMAELRELQVVKMTAEITRRQMERWIVKREQQPTSATTTNTTTATNAATQR